jgi:hypothetical protein
MPTVERPTGLGALIALLLIVLAVVFAVMGTLDIKVALLFVMAGASRLT